MNKNPPSIGRIAAMVGFALSVAALLMFLWVSFGGTLPLRPESYRFKAAFPEASLLVKEADVRMAGVNIGKVKQKELGPGGRSTVVEMEIDHRFAPIGQDAHAILRQKSLLGETYVEITPGTPGAKKLADGGTLPSAQIDNSVQLDEVFRVFDPRHAEGVPAVAPRGGNRHQRRLRARLQRLARERGTVLHGRRQPAAAAGRAGGRRSAGVVRDTGRVFHAVSRENGELSGLIANGNATFGALASRDDALAETFQIFPTFLRETRATVRAARGVRQEHRPAGAATWLSRRATSRPTLRDLGALAPDLETLFNHIHPLIEVVEVRRAPAATAS